MSDLETRVRTIETRITALIATGAILALAASLFLYVKLSDIPRIAEEEVKVQIKTNVTTKVIQEMSSLRASAESDYGVIQAKARQVEEMIPLIKIFSPESIHRIWNANGKEPGMLPKPNKFAGYGAYCLSSRDGTLNRNLGHWEHNGVTSYQLDPSEYVSGIALCPIIKSKDGRGIFFRIYSLSRTLGVNLRGSVIGYY